MFVTFIVNQRSIVIESEATAISYVFWMGVFCTPILKTFLETITVSRYCLKFLSNKNCSYCIKGDFVKIIFASGDPIVVTFFFGFKQFFHVSFEVPLSFKVSLKGKVDLS